MPTNKLSITACLKCITIHYTHCHEELGDTPALLVNHNIEVILVNTGDLITQ